MGYCRQDDKSQFLIIDQGCFEFPGDGLRTSSYNQEMMDPASDRGKHPHIPSDKTAGLDP